MRVARLYRPGDLRIEDAKPPGIRDGEVLIRVKAAGVCRSDVHYFRYGRIGDAVVTKPIILGHEFAGVVEEVGKRVDGLEPGVPVCVEPGVPCRVCEACREGNYNLCKSMKFCGTPPVDGCYREQIPYPSDFVFPLPGGLSLAEGAMIEPLAVSLHAVDLGKVKPAETVAVLGSGSIGLSVIQLVRLTGAAEIYATDLLRDRLSWAEHFGASLVINAAVEDPVRRITDATGNRGVDVVFEAAGVVETPQQAVDIVKPGGRVVLIGISSEDSIHLSASSARRKGITIKLVRRMRHTYPRAIRLVEKRLVDVKSLVTHEFSLEEIVSAFHLVESYGDGVVKAVIRI
ncbi:MAG TPA: NAD(P)-dependent alcohol dehydrogenase [Candidatus Latescibacteria bacterium]|nr:NAD(P)-dependent alcohol dehydrogenase [Candidatus Latescibacterota bacterium]